MEGVRKRQILTRGFLLVPVRKLSDLLSQVKDEQSYIVLRERTHRNTAESTNARVKWWNLFVILFLVSDFIFQVWWLRRFFEVRYSNSTPSLNSPPRLMCLFL